MSYDVLVIGGGPAGLSASINVRARGRMLYLNKVPSSPLLVCNSTWATEAILGNASPLNPIV